MKNVAKLCGNKNSTINGFRYKTLFAQIFWLFLHKEELPTHWWRLTFHAHIILFILLAFLKQR